MQFIMDVIYGIKAFFDVLLAVPFFGPVLVIGTSALMVIKAAKGK